MNILIFLSLTLWITAFGLMAFGTWLCLRHFKKAPAHLDAPFGLYPVSILKPLKGVDPGLEANLRTFFALDYPDYKIIFSVASECDPACRIARKLIAEHPEVDARLVVGGVGAGINPKINNLVRSYELAQHDWLLISDSNIQVKRGYLRRMLAQVDSGTGVVTAVVAGVNGSGLGGALEAAYLNSYYARGMLLASALGKPCVLGKSMLFRRSEAQRFGGIKSLARYLHEDFMAGEAMRKLGRKILTQVDPVEQNLGALSVSDFWSRHVRWGRIRKSQAPLAFIGELLTGSVVSGLLGAWALEAWTGLPAALVLTLHFGAWVLADLLVLKSLGLRIGLTSVQAWALREASGALLWLHIASGNTVSWRGSRMTLRPGGLIEATS
jgi:ceramide glucosyltransferase